MAIAERDFGMEGIVGCEMRASWSWCEEHCGLCGDGKRGGGWGWGWVEAAARSGDDGGWESKGSRPKEGVERERESFRLAQLASREDAHCDKSVSSCLSLLRSGTVRKQEWQRQEG